MDKNAVYPYSHNDARHNGQMDEFLCRESYKANCECKRAIETAINENFDGMHLKHDGAKDVIAEFGHDRVQWVLANTLKQLDHDGRFSHDNKEWAKGFYIPQDKLFGNDLRQNFIVSSHPAVLDGFIGQARKEYQALNLWDRTHCNNAAELDFTGKVMVLDPTMLKEAHKTPSEQLFYARGGFGCAPNSRGRKVYGQFLSDGEDTHFCREDFIGELKAEHLPEWAAEKLQAMQEKAQEQALAQSAPEQTGPEMSM